MGTYWRAITSGYKNAWDQNEQLEKQTHRFEKQATPLTLDEVVGSGLPVIFGHSLVLDHHMFEDAAGHLSNDYLWARVWP